MAADLITRGQMSSYWTVSFHSQQAAEKALKGLLTRHEIEFFRTHNIGELLLLADRAVPGCSTRLDESRELTLYAVTERYPGAAQTVDRQTAQRHLALGRSVLEAVRGALRPYLDAGRPAS